MICPALTLLLLTLFDGHVSSPLLIDLMPNLHPSSSRHAEIELRLEEIGSSTAVERAKGLLQKLGFTEALMVGGDLDLDPDYLCGCGWFIYEALGPVHTLPHYFQTRAMKSLSGGWRVRTALTAALFAQV